MPEATDLEYEVHPAADVFPLMSNQELDGLVEDIKAHGQIEPIVLSKGMIVDGRNRYRACMTLGISPQTTEWKNEGESIISYVVSKNLHRRHLTIGQRAMIGARMANREFGGNQYTQDSCGGADKSATIPEAAQLLGVNKSSISNAKTILDEGTPEEIEAVATGNAAVNPTGKAIRARKANKVPTSQAFHIKVPEGMTAEDLCREGLIQEEQGKKISAVAKSLGIGNASYRLMRDIIALADHDSLSLKDAETVATALAYMNETANVGTAAEQIRAIKERLWGTKRAGATRNQTEAKRKDKFDHACSIINHACVEGAKIEIPFLTPDEATRLIEEILLSEKSLRAFRKRIKEVSL